MFTRAKLVLFMVATLTWPGFAGAATLSDTPLVLKGSVPPNVLFALSVEFPTALVAAYQGTNDYTVGSEYLGYFDPKKCYAYDATNAWFAPLGAATGTTQHVCSGQWSGNFLNWASMAGLDEFRYAMTGGNRYVDTGTSTVLERTYQNGQGNYFPTKTFQGAGATPYGSGTSLTLTNYNKGVTMLVALGGSDTATCTNPSQSGSTFTCSLALQSNNDTGSCSTWTGTGSSSLPYNCSTFGAWSGGETFVSTAPGITSSVSTSATSTVTCASPTYTNGSFSCNLAMGGTSGTCTSWIGNGSSGSPFECSTFGLFGSNTFSVSTKAAASSFSATVTTSTPMTNNNLTCSVTNGSTMTVTCPLSTGHNATCSFARPTNAGGPYSCTGSWSSNGGETNISGNHAANSPTVSYTNSSKTRSYYTNYDLAYDNPSTGTATLWYIPSYTGSGTVSYYYYSTYTLGVSGSTTYNVRVKVCDKVIGLESNCKQYGTSYKPTGVVQDNGDTMRFGALSYFNANDIDNAVMRSKLKFVAPLMISPSNGASIANPNKEFSSTDGTLYANPDPTDASSSYNGAVSNSGVINYLNKFGSVSHTYKGYDDMGKLYYEALKYLRGLQPTTDFYNGVTSSNNDGFPVITTWDDPIQYSCQKNYIITMGDKNTWCDKRLPSGALANGTSQCNAYTDANGHAHVADAGSLGGDTGVNVATSTNALGTLEGVANLATTATGAGNSASYFMSGLAYWAHTQDIRPDDATKPATTGKQTVKTFVIDVEESKALGINSQYWYAAKYGGADSFDATTGQPQSWSTTVSIGAPYATYNGAWPKTLLRAGDPASMISAVRSAVASIQTEIGDEAALAQSSGDLRTASSAYIFHAIYNSGGWTGDVQAYPIYSTGNIAGTPDWQASTQMPSASTRLVLSFNDGLQPSGATETSTNARTGVLFNSANISTLSTRQQDLLNRDDVGSTDNHGTDRIDYLRGTQTQEAPNGFKWRARTSLLGDVINSNPVYVGQPLPNLSGTGYNTFAKSVLTRKPMVYVGGNDGMLHGFDASATGTTGANPGQELIAYVPSSVYSNLSKLMSPSYSHKFFVDGSPVVSEACSGTCTASTDWKTMLVGSLNAGGQGVYALDITNPANFTAANAGSLVLWEFTDKDDTDLGYTFSKPLIRKLNSGKWAVIFGSGYNNTTADGSASTTGRAYLYILLADGPGAGNAWVQNTNYWKIELKSPSELSTATLPLSPPNGLSSIVGLDNDSNGTTDYVYAGDLQGNLWKIDLTSSSTTNWKTALGTVAAPTPLFIAQDSSGNTQPITSGIEISRHPNGGYLLMFGTGSYVFTTDTLPDLTSTTFKTQTTYGIWDNLDGTQVARSKLQPQQQLDTFVDAGGVTYTIQSNCQPNYTTTPTNTGDGQTFGCPTSIMVPATSQTSSTLPQRGWVWDLPSNGERIVMDHPLLSGGVLTFDTLTPSIDPCTGNTIGMEYNLDYRTGGRAPAPVYDLSGVGNQSLNYIVGVTTGGVTLTAAQNIAPSGKRLSGGASDTPVRFSLPPVQTGTNTNAACANFIPGVGCPSQQVPGACKNLKLDCVASQIITPGSPPMTCTRKCLGGVSGRVSWRQLMQ